jgi:hypothetical protein
MRNAGAIATVFEGKIAESWRLSPFCNSEKRAKLRQGAFRPPRLQKFTEPRVVV